MTLSDSKYIYDIRHPQPHILVHSLMFYIDHAKTMLHAYNMSYERDKYQIHMTIIVFPFDFVVFIYLHVPHVSIYMK